MTDTVREMHEYELPFRRKAELREVQFEGGLNMLRLVLREGKRITQVDMDVDVATKMANDILAWAKEQN